MYVHAPVFVRVGSRVANAVAYFLFSIPHSACPEDEGGSRSPASCGNRQCAAWFTSFNDEELADWKTGSQVGDESSV